MLEGTGTRAAWRGFGSPRMTGCRLFWEEGGLLWMRPPRRLLSDFSIITGPFPAFPTDMQPLLMALLTLAKGHCMISETVFEARFSQAEGLCRMGADIRIEGRRASVFGVERLFGAEVFARDLRCGAGAFVRGTCGGGRKPCAWRGICGAWL